MIELLSTTKKLKNLPIQNDITNYFLVDINIGKQLYPSNETPSFISPKPPKIGEHLNQSGLYFEVLGTSKHLDSNCVDVYVTYIGIVE